MRGRAVAVLCVVVLAAAIGAAPVSASPAAGTAAETNIEIVRTSPQTPIAGERFSITFALMKGDQRLRAGEFDCYAQANRRVVPLVSRERIRRLMRCTWAIPATATGTLDGILVAIREGTRYFYGFEYPIR